MRSAHYPWYDAAGPRRQSDRRRSSSRRRAPCSTPRASKSRATRSQSRAGTERHRHRQHAVGRVRRLYRLHFRQPLRAQLQRRRHRPAVRADRRRDFRADAGRRPHAARLHAEIRARRPPDLSRRRPAAQMDRPVAAAAFLHRISVAAGDHRHHRAMGLHCRHPDRRRDRLRHLCPERLAHRFHQIQFRRLGIPQFARPLARGSGGAVGAWRQDPGPEPAELSVLRLGQPALPARQGAARAASGMPLSGVRLQARHRHRFLGGLQLRPDQAQRRRTAASSWCWCTLPPAAEKALRSSEFISHEVSIVPELDHALEWCENEIIAQHQGLEQEEASLRDWFTADSRHRARRRRTDRIAASGWRSRPAKSSSAPAMPPIPCISSSTAASASWSRPAKARTTRVRSLGRYTTIGEMGLVSHAPRSATIQAEVASMLYVLSAPQFEAIKTRRSGARPEATDLFRLGDGRAADLRQPHDRGAAAVSVVPRFADTTLCVLAVLVLRYPLHWDRRDECTHCCG